MTRIDARLQNLLDKDEIRDVLNRIAKGTDRQDADLIRSGYHPDGIDDHGMFYGTGAEFADWATSGMSGSRSQHMIGQTLIEIDGEVALSEMYANCNLILPTAEGHEKDLFHGVRYLDRFERRDGGPWLIAYRLVCWDWAFYLPAADKAEGMDTAEWGKSGHEDASYHINQFHTRLRAHHQA